MSYDSHENILLAWRESADYWEKRRSQLEALFGPITAALIRAAGIDAGQSVLDVAGGIGDPSLAVAAVVGPAGSVIHTDPAPEMTEAAKREAKRRGFLNFSSQIASADALPFEDSSFDSAVCRLGAMFFPSPLSALQEMLRVIRPGGVLALAVWGSRDRNPFFTVVTDVMSRFVEPAPEMENSPGAFRFSKPGHLAAILAQAGAERLEENFLSFRIRAPLSIDEYWPLRVDLSDTLRGKLKRLPEVQRTAIGTAVRDASKDFFRSGVMDFPAEAILVSGLKKG